MKALLDDAVALLGASMRDRFAPGLAQELGTTWFKRVSPSQGDFAQYDFASYADCLLGDNERTREHRDLFRRVAGLRWPEYGTALREAKRTRNEIIHPGRIFDRRATAKLLDDLAALATALELGCGPELVTCAQAVRDGKAVEGRAEQQAATDRIQKITTELEREREEKAALAEQARAADDLVARSSEALARANETLDQEKALRRRAEAELASAEHARTERQQLELESQTHRRAAEEAQRRAEAAVRATQEAEAQKAALAHQVQASQQRILELEAESRSVLVQSATASEGTDEVRALVERADALASRLETLRAGHAVLTTTAPTTEPTRSRVVAAGTAGARGTHSVKPGEKWPYGAGEYSYSLRPSAADVYEYETDTWLSDVIGKPRARQVVARLLKHRAEGGTIRVDSDGDVSTQRRTGGGRFYLGRVDPADWFPGVVEVDVAPTARTTGNRGTQQPGSAPRTDIGPASHSVRPGQKWPYGAGEFSYSLRPSTRDIYEYETDTWLSDVIGKPTAHQVFDRLAQHRPEGGTIRVDTDGDVSTQRKTGGGRFYLGRVAATEWFPGVVQRSIA